MRRASVPAHTRPCAMASTWSRDFLRAVEAQLSRERGRADAIDAYPDLAERPLDRRDDREDADRARDGGRARPDLIGRRRDVVAPRSRIAAHRHDDGLARVAQLDELAIDLLGGEHAATGAV